VKLSDSLLEVEGARYLVYVAQVGAGCHWELDQQYSSGRKWDLLGLHMILTGNTGEFRSSYTRPGPVVGNLRYIKYPYCYEVENPEEVGGILGVNSRPMVFGWAA